MSTLISNEYTVNYTDEFTTLIALVQRFVIAQETIATNVTSITASLKNIEASQETIATSQTSIANSEASKKTIQETYLGRASNRELGIYVNADGESDGGLSRAMTVNALKSTGQLSAISAEMINPTPLP